MSAENQPNEAVGPSAVTVGLAKTRLWGMTSAERLSRIYRRLGLVEAGPETVFIAGDVVVVDAGWVFDESLIKALAGRPGVALVDEAGRVVAVNVPAARAREAIVRLDTGEDVTALAATRLTALELGSAYNSALRKREPRPARRQRGALVANGDRHRQACRGDDDQEHQPQGGVVHRRQNAGGRPVKAEGLGRNQFRQPRGPPVGGRRNRWRVAAAHGQAVDSQ